MCGHGLSGHGAVAAADDVDELFRGEVSASHLDEGSDDGSDHVAQESVGCDAEVVFSGCVVDKTGCGYVANVCFDVCVCFAEACKVGKGGQNGGCGVHYVEIEGGEHAARAVCQEGGFEKMHVVVVGSACGVETGVCLGDNGAYVAYCDVGGEDAVEFAYQKGTVKVVVGGVEVGCHKPGVDSGVGSSGTDNRGVGAKEGG